MSDQDLQRLANFLAGLDDPQFRKECEARTNQRNKLSEHEAEQRHYRAQAQKLK